MDVEMTMTKYDSALKWFTGKALEGAKLALDLLVEAEGLGYWPKGKGGSRKVMALLNKQNVANKFTKRNKRTGAPAASAGLDGLKLPDPDKKMALGTTGWYLAHVMEFGLVNSAPDALALAKSLAYLCTTDAERNALAVATSWAEDWTPVAKSIEILDATRFKPTFFLGTLSATVLSNVSKFMKADLKSLKVPEMKYTLVDKVDPKTGRAFKDWEVEILWPEGTKHNTSQYARGNCCHACGHRIYNIFNWVPMVAESPTGPVSLWTGKDCAENLFGCKVENVGTELPGAPVGV